jgi:hypothetical protein
MPPRPEPASLRPFLRSAAALSAVITAYHVAARAARDTLYLTNYPVRTLPMMVAVASALSIVSAIFATRRIARLGPGRFLPMAFSASAVLTLAEWALSLRDSGHAAILVYVHVATLGAVLIGGFWALVNERLDPRSVKRAVGAIGGFGTLGGLAGGAIVERVTAWQGVGATFPVLAVAHAWCAWAIARLASSGFGAAAPAAGARRLVAAASESLSVGEGARRVLATPYLQNLALLVFGTTLCSGLLDYVFKAQVTDAMGGSMSLMRFFSVYYAAVSLLTFLGQTLLSGRALERLGLARTIGALPMAVVAGSTAAALAMSPWTIGAVRGIQAVLEGSLYRAGRELLYTPIPSYEKRGTRMLIEIVCDRAGEISSAALVALVLAASPFGVQSALLWITVPCAAVMLFVVSRVQSGYVASLEAGLRAGRLRLDPTHMTDLTTMRTIQGAIASRSIGSSATRVLPPKTPTSFEAAARAAAEEASEGVGEAVAPETSGLPSDTRELVALLLDPQCDFDTRRRIPALLARAPSPLAASGLLHGLEDPRFEVRYRCGRALARMLEGDRSLTVDADAVLDAVRREAALGRRIWESQRLLDQLDEPVADAFVDRFVRDRSGRSLEHVFTLLSLVLPTEPLRIAYRGLNSDDRLLRGTALEYLEAVLPPDVRDVLWPHLDPSSIRMRRGAGSAPPRDRAQVLDDLMRSNRSIELNLEELRRREGRPAPDPRI